MRVLRQVRERWASTGDALANIKAVRGFLNSSAVGQPLNWTDLPPSDTQVSCLSTCSGWGGWGFEGQANFVCFAALPREASWGGVGTCCEASGIEKKPPNRVIG